MELTKNIFFNTDKLVENTKVKKFLFTMDLDYYGKMYLK